MRGHGGLRSESLVFRIGPSAREAFGSNGARGCRSGSSERERITRNGQRARSRHPYDRSGGNVFADMGLPEAEEELTKAQLASHIRQVIKRQRLTQVAAAAVMGY